MNPEILISKAAIALEWFQKSHNTNAYLFFEDGHVVAWDAAHCKHRIPDCLKITPYQMRVGLTSSQWISVGLELLYLYNKENACQAHPKP